MSDMFTERNKKNDIINDFRHVLISELKNVQGMSSNSDMEMKANFLIKMSVYGNIVKTKLAGLTKRKKKILGK